MLIGNSTNQNVWAIKNKADLFLVLIGNISKCIAKWKLSRYNAKCRLFYELCLKRDEREIDSDPAIKW